MEDRIFEEIKRFHDEAENGTVLIAESLGGRLRFLWLDYIPRGGHVMEVARKENGEYRQKEDVASVFAWNNKH